MNTPLRTFAKAGVADAGAALQGAIQHIKDVATQSEATSAAIKIFGAKAGPELADAIRSGRLEVEQFLTKIKEGPDTINRAAKETMSFGEQVDLMRNKVMLALEPIGDRVPAAPAHTPPTRLTV